MESKDNLPGMYDRGFFRNGPPELDELSGKKEKDIKNNIGQA